MVEAFVLLKIAHKKDMYGCSRFVVDKLRTIKQVEYVDLLWGDYDAIVKLKSDKIHDVENLVIEEMSIIDGVESTVTLLCVDERKLR